MEVIAKSFLPTIFSKETSYWIWKMENGIDENLSPTGEFVGGQGHPWGEESTTHRLCHISHPQIQMQIYRPHIWTTHRLCHISHPQIQIYRPQKCIKHINGPHTECAIYHNLECKCIDHKMYHPHTACNICHNLEYRRYWCHICVILHSQKELYKMWSR